MAKLDTRLELRLDKRTFEQLERRAAAGDLSVAELVRRAIARELADDQSSWREQMLERGLSLRVPVPDDPSDLVRELDARYEAEVPASSGPAACAPVPAVAPAAGPAAPAPGPAAPAADCGA